MKISFDKGAFQDFTDWAILNKENYKKIIILIKVINRSPFEGIGKPEPLKHQLKGYWSRQINDEHRLVYKVENDEISIISCKGHY